MNYKITGKVLSLLTILFSGVHALLAQTTFNYTGAQQTYVVPAGVSSIHIECYGAQGGHGGPSTTGLGGLGGFAEGDLNVTPGQTLYIYVGGQGESYVLNGTGGWNGGAGTAATSDDNKRPGCGGGGTDVRVGGTALTDRVIVAGGGGGASGWMNTNGGMGGGLVGEDGLAPLWQPDWNGKGGTQSAGGLGGDNAGDGSLGLGGSGLGNSHGGGGGGGGYYGGGGGKVDAGGGGSSYIDGVLNGATVSGQQTGDGMVVITVLCSGLTFTPPADTLCQFTPITLDATSPNGGNITWDMGVTNGVEFTPVDTGWVTYSATSDDPSDCGVTYNVYFVPAPDFSLTSTDELFFNDGTASITLNGGIFPFTYDWDNDGTGDFDDPQNLTGLAAGTYTVTVMQGNGCSATDSITVGSQVGVAEMMDNMLTVYPNPTSGNYLNIAYEGLISEVVVQDMLGRTIQLPMDLTGKTVNVSSLIAGTYFIKVSTEAGMILKEFVITK